MSFAAYLTKINNAASVKKGAAEIIKFRNQIPQQYRSIIDPPFNRALSELSSVKKAAGNIELGNYIDELIKQ